MRNFSTHNSETQKRHHERRSKKAISVLVGVLFSLGIFPAKAQDITSAIDLMTTYWTYIQVCAQWTGGLSEEQTNRVIAVAKANGFQIANREHIGLIAAKSIERSSIWKNSLSLATRCTEAKFALTN